MLDDVHVVSETTRIDRRCLQSTLGKRATFFTLTYRRDGRTEYRTRASDTPLQTRMGDGLAQCAQTDVARMLTYVCCYRPWAANKKARIDVKQSKGLTYKQCMILRDLGDDARRLHDATMTDDHATLVTRVQSFIETFFTPPTEWGGFATLDGFAYDDDDEAEYEEEMRHAQKVREAIETEQ